MPAHWTEQPAVTLLGELKVNRYQLNNGLRVRFIVDRSAPVICFQQWFGVGSRHERLGKTGIAHLFEHLMFGETEHREHGAFDRELEQAGAETNAATFLDWTYYHTNLPKEALALSVGLESDRMRGLVLRDEQVAREKDVVQNERRQRVDDDVEGAVSERLYREAFRVHTYGHPTIGWMKDIEGFTVDDCVAFYRTYYAPNNCVLVLAGDVDIPEALDLIQKGYGTMQAQELPLDHVWPEPPQTEERRVRMDKPTGAHKLAIGYKAPSYGDPDHTALVLLNEIVFGGRGSRAYRALVREKELAIDVRGWPGSFREAALWDLSLSARPGVEPAPLLEALDALLAGVLNSGVTLEELERAKTRVELGVVQGLETASGKAEHVGFSELVLGDPGAGARKLDEIARATTGDLLRVARRVLAGQARTVVEVWPSGEGDETDEEADEAGEDDE